MRRGIMFCFLVCTILLVSVPFVFAEDVKKGSIPLLAVREVSDGELVGGIADLSLELRPGSGRVFLQTYPLTKTDTQMSTRFAKTIACDFAEVDCESVDFFYTITSNSPIIAGPSAGSSIAALTVALLMDLEIDDDVAGTGTINSGGIVGPVGGVKAKIEAADETELRKVVIPAGESVGLEENSSGKNLSEVIALVDIEVVETSTIDDVVFHFTGYERFEEDVVIDVDSEYSSRMKVLAQQLCDRGEELVHDVPESDFIIENETINVTFAREIIDNLTRRGRSAFEEEDYYASASYCFGANVQISTVAMQFANLSEDAFLERSDDLVEEIEEMRKEISERRKKTITDLETFMVVRERLDEAQDFVVRARTAYNVTNSTFVASRNLAYGVERFKSAQSWATFFGSEGKEFDINPDTLRETCQTKISEVEEGLQYVGVYFPEALSNVYEDLDDAQFDLEHGNYELCLFKASKAKADVGIVLSIFGVDPSHYATLLGHKLDVVEESLSKQTTKGIFPIVGYSYYEYAQSLNSSDTLSGLLYAEYALELGNLDIYFDEPIQTRAVSFVSERFDWEQASIFLIGVGFGLLVSLVFTFVGRKPKKLEIKIDKK